MVDRSVWKVFFGSVGGFQVLSSSDFSLNESDQLWFRSDFRSKMQMLETHFYKTPTHSDTKHSDSQMDCARTLLKTRPSPHRTSHCPAALRSVECTFDSMLCVWVVRLSHRVGTCPGHRSTQLWSRQILYTANRPTMQRAHPWRQQHYLTRQNKPRNLSRHPIQISWLVLQVYQRHFCASASYASDKLCNRVFCVKEFRLCRKHQVPSSNSRDVHQVLICLVHRKIQPEQLCHQEAE
jgi:hypothetical protein